MKNQPLSKNDFEKNPDSNSIPAIYHFVWYGDRFPYLNRVAIESVVRRCPSSRVFLWHSDNIDDQQHFQAITNLPQVSSFKLTADSLLDPFHNLKHQLDIPLLKEIYTKIESNVTRSNIARAAILYQHGGVYLDMDTLVIRDLTPLLGFSGFLGVEHILWPYTARQRFSFYRFFGGHILALLRTIAGIVPRGELLYKATKQLYYTAVNGAIMGFSKGHPFLAELLANSSQIPRSNWQIKHRLGTHVLQETADKYTNNDLKLLDTSHFYPLGPVVSKQFFKNRKNPQKDAESIILPTTYVVHWYASVSELTHYSPDDLNQNTPRNVFEHLCSSVINNTSRTETSN